MNSRFEGTPAVLHRRTTAPALPVPEMKLPPLADGNQYRFHAVVKPAGAQCNLDCDYCFYLRKDALLGQPRRPRMGLDVLEAHIRQYIEAQTGPEVVCTWQGGEPTLMGLPFFRQVIDLQKQYAKPGQQIHNDLQTNGLLLDDDWALFLKEHRFLVGLSIDGPAELHDRYRRTHGGKATFIETMRAVELLRRHDVAFNALCVVNRHNARRPIDVYRFLRDEVSPRIIQFLPCVEPVGFERVAPLDWKPENQPLAGSEGARPGRNGSVVTEWSVDAEDWGYFLGRIWDEWLRRDYGKVHVDQFENVISQLFGFGAQSCVSAEFCGKTLAIEHDGGVFSCDHFVYPAYRLGDLRSVHEGDLAFGAAQREFGFAKRDRLTQQCRSCKYLPLCWGECPRNRFVKSSDGEPGLSYLCPGLKMFYAKVSAARSELHRRLQQR